MIRDSKSAVLQADRKRAYAFGLVMLVIMVIATSFSGYLFLKLMQDEENRLAGTIGAILNEAISRISFSGKYHSRLLLEEMQKRLPELAYISVETLDGSIEAHSDSSMNDKPVHEDERRLSQKALEGGITILTEKIMDGKAVKEVLIPYKAGLSQAFSGVVRVGLKVDDTRKRQRNNLFLQVLIIIVLTISAAGIMGILSRYFSRRLADSENALLESESRYRTFFEKGPDGIVILDPETVRIVEFNDQACRQLGYTREEFKRLRVSDIEAKESAEETRAHIQKVMDERHDDFETLQRTKQGETRHVHVTAQVIEGSGGPVYHCIWRDITDRKRAEEALKEKTRFLDKIIETSALSTWISDEKGTAIRTNPACLEFFGATEEEVVGKYNLFKDTVIEKQGFMPIIKEIFETGRPASFLIDYDFGAVGHVDIKNATHKIIQTVLTPVLDNNKKVSNVIVQALDLTEIKKSEKESIRINKLLSEHEKLSLVGKIAGKMAHDFNNILGIIMGNTELALIDCPDDSTRKKLDLIYDQTIRGKNLTRNLVAFAKDQEPKQEFFSIDEKMDLVLNLLKKDLDGIDVIRQYNHGIPELLADSGMIEHAIINLVQNSIHAVSLVERPQIIVRIYHQEEFIFFEIEDNGCGIPSESIEEIYEPSFSLKGSRDKLGMYKPGIKGTGYGMSNVKRYIEQHKGEISIHSEVQKGTKVVIKLPVIKKELTDDEIKNVKKEIIYFEKYILLVEDEQAISDIQYRILTHEPCNHKVDIANTGQMAVDLLGRNQYDLISLDYILPRDFNGMDVYHHIRKTNNTVPVLFISGNIEFLESIKDLKQKDPYIDHLSKPCKNIDYVSCINNLFGIVANKS
ncbi:MAG: PAS domain S-box protein [Desulfobacteraceae bacterium]|nr:PAS domain S-box protein [Desulfobacteraceae bacterium]